ncbi:glycosyltransferase [Sphingomonas psychrotolerans]|uniref:glycosyltransferase n=1 Tax=Sphingomonas psychrotolerans TaxID=1327635 RepID=UPI001305174D|nr:glycosyltransferase [Sphingomonas psychrotolerans]
MTADIILFAFKRADHLQRTLASLASNAEASASSLTIYCDGARGSEDEAGVAAVREAAAKATGFREVRTVSRDANMGLAGSVVAGVGEALERSDRVIVVEDDLQVAPHFLRYMNDALDEYAEEERVASIHGWRFPTRRALPDTFFIRGADCWGWATWRRAWPLYEPDGSKLLAQLEERRLTRAFDLDGSYPFTAMLRDQIAGRNNSWAVRWHAACFLADRLTLHPGRSLVHNIGNDGSGTHSLKQNRYDTALFEGILPVGGIAIEESDVGRHAMAESLRSSPLRRAARWLRRKARR